MTAHASEGIRAELACRSLGRVDLARAFSSRSRVSRIATQTEERHLVFHMLHRGRAMLSVGDTSRDVGTGAICITDDHQPYAIDISDDNDCLILQVPISIMGEDLARQDLHGAVLSGHDPNVAFLGFMLQGLWSQRELFDNIDADTGLILSDAAKLACRKSCTTQPEQPACISPIDYVLRHLADPELGTAMICSATGMSARTIQKTFLRHAGLSPTAFISERRLERAAALLERNDGRSITDVAFEVGFSDSAFFSRCFRRKFGAAPSRWRS